MPMALLPHQVDGFLLLLRIDLEGEAQDGCHAAQLMQLLARHVQRREAEEAAALALHLHTHRWSIEET
jgi:hypothetical protein